MGKGRNVRRGSKVCFGPEADSCTAANYVMFDYLVGAAVCRWDKSAAAPQSDETNFNVII